MKIVNAICCERTAGHRPLLDLYQIYLFIYDILCCGIQDDGSYHHQTAADLHGLNHVGDEIEIILN